MLPTLIPEVFLSAFCNFPYAFPLALLAFMFSADFFFVFSNQAFLSFVEILPFSFCPVNSESGAYLAVDHSSVYSLLH